MKEIITAIPPYTKGDWIRFYREGELTIGQIEYFWTETGGFKYAATDKGAISIDSILEHRRKE